MQSYVKPAIIASAAILFTLSASTCILQKWKTFTPAKSTILERSTETPTTSTASHNFNVINDYGLPSLDGSKLPEYSHELAKIAIRPSSWICGKEYDNTVDPLTHQKPFFIFVHVYKTAGSTLRSFFQKFAQICSKSWVLVIHCTGVNLSTIQSEEGNWEKCDVKSKLESVASGRRDLSVNNSMLRERFDILGGHLRIGTADNVFRNSSSKRLASLLHYSGESAPPLRHIVFLRNPMDRYVSGVLYQKFEVKKKNYSVDQVVEIIKEQVIEARKKNQYQDRILSYLLTPVQVDSLNKYLNQVNKMKSDNCTIPDINVPKNMGEYKTLLAIHNLFHYNVIVGMTERMPESMQILKQILGNEFRNDKNRKDVYELFEKFAPTEASREVQNNVKISNQTIDSKSVSDGVLLRTVNSTQRDDVSHGVVMNASKKISTSFVLEQLRRDEKFMILFREFLKYEQMIVDFAWGMHEMQHEIVLISTGSTL